LKIAMLVVVVQRRLQSYNIIYVEIELEEWSFKVIAKLDELESKIF